MIAIVIPTMNRPQYLKRALDYYLNMEFNGKIYIGDSSTNDDTKNIVHSSNYVKLNLFYLRDNESLHDGQTVQKINKWVNNTSIKYVVFAGDDDFLVPEGLYKCADFLDKNPEYVAAHGHRINYTVGEDGPAISGVRYGYDFDNETSPETRWTEYVHVGIALANYLHRKEVWLERYQYQHLTPSRYLGPEFLAESITVLSGPIKYLSDCTSFFFYQNNPDRIFSFVNQDLFELIHTHDWVESFHNIRSILMDQYNLDPKLVKRLLWYHITNILLSQYDFAYDTPINITAKGIGQQVNFLEITKAFSKIQKVF